MADRQAQRYHEATKHSPQSVRAGGRLLDWSNQPNPFKDYPDLDPIPLPQELPRPEVPALEALAAGGEPVGGIGFPDLARVLRWGAGVVRTRRFPGGEAYHFRTYASAGALYPVEVYLACAELPGLEAGLYHFHPGELALRRLRGGDLRGVLTAAADESGLADAGAVLLLTGILWRTAWKYEGRGYRHLFWDAGTMLANLLSLSASARLAPRLFTGFVDTEVNHLLGVDGDREAALALLALGSADPSATPGDRHLDPLELRTPPLSRRELPFPEASQLHEASSFAGVEEVRRYREALSGSPGPPMDRPASRPASEPLEEVIRRRGSSRDYSPESVPVSELESILSRAAAPIPADTPALTEIYLIANAIDGLDPGAYRFLPDGGFEQLRPGEFRREAAVLCLEQPLGGCAAATHFLLADLEGVLAALGDRGYRAVQLEAGIRAGRAYLAAYAQGLGATGLTFYDDLVAEFLTGDTAKQPMMCFTVGIDPRRPALRRLRDRSR